jgi:hypothetical protein
VDSYLLRRRKEDLSFLVVRFLRAYDQFEGIYRDFREAAAGGQGFGGTGLFRRVKELEEKLVYDIKEKAHFLFRGPAPAGEPFEHYEELERLLAGGKGEAGGGRSREILAGLRRSLVDRSLDADIGTGFHMFMILRECLYQLEVYAPRYGTELEQAERLEKLARRIGSALGEEEAHELDHIRQIVKHGQGVAAYTRQLAERSLERCHDLFLQTAELLRHLIEESGGNEVLVLNLLREREAVERVYGEGAAEHLFGHMFRKSGKHGTSGLAKALAFARKNCGNTEALDA